MLIKIYDFVKSNFEKNYTLYTGITAGIFVLQIIHLYWLSTHVLAFKLFGISLFDPNTFWQFVIIIVDYFEIPAIIATSILYIHSLAKKWNKRDIFLLLLLNTQWLHIFWISDEFVISVFRGGYDETILPVWLAYVAIFIDYLELPVMYDVMKKFVRSFLSPKNISAIKMKKPDDTI